VSPIPEQNRRQHYRIVYPSVLAPRLILNALVFAVVDISEWGVRFKKSDYFVFRPGVEVEGDITLFGGEKIHISGTIFRGQNDDVVIALDRKIPFSVILSEQTQLRKNYYLQIEIGESSG
jgi:hypothetical protein